MKPFSVVLGLIGAGLISLRIDKAAAAEVIGTFGPLTIEGRHMPTPDLPGYSTWTLTASSEGGILGIDFFGRRESQPGDPDARGFFGPMNQVNPSGSPTTIDSVDVCPVCHLPDNSWLAQDSHFLTGGRPIVVPFGFLSESTSHLRAIFARQGPGSFGNRFDFVQLVVPNEAPKPTEFRGIIVVGPDNNLREITFSGSLPQIPEPASAVLASFALFAAGSVRRRRMRRQ
ncbi:MAG TPA: hypothetical protein VHK01_21340 [Lacipirellulaceae bacterium]|jgi:hypothetical protein|nr:hypothetical protein [Lacipirellulaceae bacterium]